MEEMLKVSKILFCRLTPARDLLPPISEGWEHIDSLLPADLSAPLSEAEGALSGEGNGGDSMVLELDEKEKETVKRALVTLEDELKTVRMKTDKREVRSALHDDEYMIERILKKVA